MKLLQDKYGIADGNVILHQDCGATLCPGKYLDRQHILNWKKDLGKNISGKVFSQQKQVIEDVSVSYLRIIEVLVVLFVVLFWSCCRFWSLRRRGKSKIVNSCPDTEVLIRG